MVRLKGPVAAEQRGLFASRGWRRSILAGSLQRSFEIADNAFESRGLDDQSIDFCLEHTFLVRCLFQEAFEFFSCLTILLNFLAQFTQAQRSKVLDYCHYQEGKNSPDHYFLVGYFCGFALWLWAKR